MADAIVQTIKVQVEGTEEAAAEFKKVGDAGTQAFSEAEKAADSASKSIADAGSQASGGLNEMSKSAGVSSKEMKALAKVMGSFGAGEAGAAAFSFYRVATSLGVLGVAALAVGKAFQVVTEAVKSAKETGEAINHMAEVSGNSVESMRALQGAFATVGVSGKELADTVSNLALSIAKAKSEQAPGWFKEWANDIDDVTSKMRNLGQAIPQAISPLTKTETLKAGLLAVFADLGTNMDAIVRRAATIWEALSPLQRVQFAPAFKEFFTDAQMELIRKGPAAIDALTASMEKLSAQNLRTTATTGKFSEQLIAIGALQSDAAVGLENLGAAGQKASAGFRDWDEVVKELTSGFKTMTDDEAEIAARTAAMAPAAQATGTAFQNLAQAVDASIAQVKAAIESWVTTPAANAWQWVVDTATSAWNSVKQLGQQAYDAVVAFVTTAPGNAWQWIVDTFQAVIAKIKAAFGFGGGEAAPAGGGGSGFARGGLLGGRGSGTSDSNLAWVSRGEYIVPARVVGGPGVLALLESLRLAGGNLRGLLGGMHFAAGGLIMPRAVPAFAGGGMHNVTIQFPGLPEISGLRASSGVVDELRRAAALGQVRSGGRKPSRYS